MEISTDSFDDDSTALWKISTSSSAILKFNASSTKTVLDGDFEIINFGKLAVDSGGFQTNGTLVWTGGTIDVASGAIADFGAFPETDPSPHIS